jgi:hypothetical protein
VIAVLVFAQSCGHDNRSISQSNQLEPLYNRKSGRLEQLKYDSDGDGKFDTFSYMDGSTILRIEIDRDEDGKIDRWEYYGPGKTLERVGLSRAQNGVEDTWQYLDASGTVVRVEMGSQDSKKKTLERIEHYEKGVLVRAEEDTDRDGVMDKWETYEGNRVTSVAFDERHLGRPTLRIVYSPDGATRIDVDPAGDGHFISQSAQTDSRRSQ